MDASLFKVGTQTQRDFDSIVWTQTQPASKEDETAKMVQDLKIKVKRGFTPFQLLPWPDNCPLRSFFEIQESYLKWPTLN